MSINTTADNLADACMKCFPGDHPAVLPSVVHDTGGSLCAHYTCPVCACSWRCWWNPESVQWPTERRSAA